MFYFKDKENFLNILVKVHPNAKNTKVNKTISVETIYPVKKALQIDLKTPPAEGKANKELIKFISKVLSISKSDLELVSGKKARIKLVKIKNIEKKDLELLNT